MTAQFGLWPPAVIGSKLIGRCIVNTDGTLAYSSKYADGTPVFASTKTATGEYHLVPGKPIQTTAQLQAQSIQLPLADATFADVAAIQTPVGTFDVITYNAAGAAADSAFSAELFDS
ncbi:MAG: hypothetical protein ACOYD1_12790 [Candidatus Nanopelagicales bacterium]